jgi:hypothetical protein
MKDKSFIAGEDQLVIDVVFTTLIDKTAKQKPAVL